MHRVMTAGGGDRKAVSRCSQEEASFPDERYNWVALDTAWEERDIERQGLGCRERHFRKRKQQELVQGSWKVHGMI